jgi:hypothetical protein
MTTAPGGAFLATRSLGTRIAKATATNASTTWAGTAFALGTCCSATSEVPSGVGAGIIDKLVIVVQSHVGGTHPNRAPIPVEEATDDARRMLAQGRGVSTDSTLVEEVREQPPGVRLTLRGPGVERYAVDVERKGRLYHLTRLG